MGNYKITLIILSFVFALSACKKKDSISETYGIINGTVKTSLGLPVPDAIVKISTLPKETTTTTSETGNYSIKFLTPQSYQVTISKTGYVTNVQNILVVVGETRIYDFELNAQAPFVNTSLNSITTGNNQGSSTLTVSSNVTWTVSTSATWLTCSPVSGENNGVITLNFTENTTPSERQADIIVTGTGVVAIRNVSVTQLNIALLNDGDHLLMGNPTNAVTDISSPNNYLMVKSQYVLSYNNTTHTPNWVSWNLSDTWIGNLPRPDIDPFMADPALPTGWHQTGQYEYSGSGFDRGHMCPSADRNKTVIDNTATFLMTNMIPQAPDNNRLTWENLERYCRTLVSGGNELYIISGPYGQGGEGNNGTKNTIGNGVVVPNKVWKIIVVLPIGTNDLSRVSATTRVIAVITPNDQSCDSHPWGYYRTSVNAIETLTGYDFLSNVPANIENVIEAAVDNGSTGQK